jgi:hypothetical protein
MEMKQDCIERVLQLISIKEYAVEARAPGLLAPKFTFEFNPHHKLKKVISPDKEMR